MTVATKVLESTGISEISSVPLLDLKAQYEPLADEIMSAIRDVCDSQRFVMGPKVQELEARIAEYSHAGFGVGVSSGTDALLVALMALEVGPGDEVITSPFTFFATGGAIARVGATPVFCDIDPESYNLDPSSVRRFITEKCKRDGGKLINRESGRSVRVLMPVHLFGQVADMDNLGAIAEEFGLKVIEDAAQAIGAEDRHGRRAGAIGDIGCFSFFPSKNLGAFGDGGMCVTNDEELAEKLRILRVHGGKPKYYHAVIGGNFRLDAIQAAILLIKLRELDSWTARRQQNARNYSQLLARYSDRLGLPVLDEKVRHIFNQYTIRSQDRDELRAHLAKRNVGTEIYYPVPLHLQECFSSLGYGVNDCPKAVAAAKEVVSIPVYPELSIEQQKYVVSTIAEFLESAPG